MKAGIITLARIIGRRFGVNVVVDPHVGTAATDGKTIFVPPVDLSLKEDADLLEGLIDHEAMHCRLTTFEVNGDTDLERGISNIFEDVWGETDFANIYPGTRRTINRAAEIMATRKIIGMKLKGNEPPAEILGQVLVNGLRSRVLGQRCLEDAYLHNLELLKQAVGEPLAEKIWGTSLKVRDVHSTSAALDLTREIIDLIKDEQQQQQQQQAGSDGKEGDATGSDGPKQEGPEQGGQGENQNQAKDGSGKQANQSQDEGENQGQNKEGSGKQPGQSPGEEKGSPGKEGNTASGKGGAESSPEKLAKTLAAIGKILAASKDEIGKTDLGAMVDAVLPKSTNIDFSAPAKELPVQKAGWDIQISTAIRTMRNSLSSRLSHLFDTQEETKIWLDKSGRKLDRSTLAGIATGRQNVFRKVEYGDELSVEVSLVIDCSISMRHEIAPEVSRLDAAQTVAVALGDVLDQYDIPFSMTLFAESVCTYKATDQNWGSAKKCNMRLTKGGDTRTGWAVTEGSKDILFSDRDRKLMLVVTDGLPDDIDFAVSESAEIQKTGVEVRYIMIGGFHGELSKALRAAGIHFSVADSPDVLARAVFEAVEPRLAQRMAA